MVEETSDYNGLNEVVKDFEIERATPTIELKFPENLVYNGQNKVVAAVVTGVAEEEETLTATVSCYNDDTYTDEVEDVINVGTYYVKAIFKGNGNYNEKEETGEFAITQAKAKINFAQNEVTIALDGTVDNKLTPEDVKVTYSSGDESVATVDAETGAVTIIKTGSTTIKATIEDANYEEASASYKLTVTNAELGSDAIKADGNTEIFITLGQSSTLTAIVTKEGLGADGVWTWESDNTDVATVTVTTPAQSVEAQSSSTATVTPLRAGTATITATYTDSKYTGTVEYTITVEEEEEEEVTPPPYYPSYYDLAFDANDSVSFSAHSATVREGGSFRFTAQAAEGYDPATLTVEYRRGRWGSWQILTPETDGEYHIYNVWNNIYVRASVDRKEEEPTANLPVDDAATRIRAVGNRIGIRLPYPSSLCIVGLDGRVIRQADLPAGDSWINGLPQGVCIVVLADGTRAKVMIR